MIVGGFGNATRGFQSSVVGGSQNCAGGDVSWAGGARAKIRPGNAVFPEPVGGACRNVPQTGDPMGDRGTFVWADSQDAESLIRSLLVMAPEPKDFDDLLIFKHLIY